MPALTTLGAVERDEDLLAALARLADAGPGWFSATGYVSDVELRLPSPEGFISKQLPGSYTLVHLAGVSTGPFFVALTRFSGDAIESWGGELVRARSLGVYVASQPGRLSVASADVAVVPPTAHRGDAAPSVDSSPGVPRAAMAAAPPKPAWAMAALASARSQAGANGESEDAEVPEAGDLVDHFAFGRCEVVSTEGDRLRLRDVKPPGRVREVSVEMLRVMPPVTDEGKRLFVLARRVPR